MIKRKIKYGSKPTTPKEVCRLKLIDAECHRDGDTSGAVAAAEAIKVLRCTQAQG